MLISKNTYTDLSFFVTKNPFTGDINLVKDMVSLKYCLKNLILTQFGERPFNFEVGTGIYARVFGAKTEDNKIVDEIHQTIYNNDSRIDDILVKINRNDKTINIDVEFKIKGSEIVNIIQVTL